MSKWYDRFSSTPDELPPELKGLKEEDLLAAIKAKSTLDAKVAELETKLAEGGTASSTLTQELNMLRGKVAEMEAAVVRQRPAPTTENQEPTNWFEDPDKKFNERIAPYERLMIDTGVTSAKLAAERQIIDGIKEGKLWKKYGEEVTKLVNAMPPVQRMQADTWLNTFTYVKGLHVKDFVGQAGDDFFSEGPGRSEVDTRDESRSSANADKLTDKEIEIAKSMKVSPEDYLKHKKKIEVYRG
jgi:hypothetical protein